MNERVQAAQPPTRESARSNRAVSVPAQAVRAKQPTGIAGALLALQRQLGNRYVQRALAAEQSRAGGGAVRPGLDTAIARSRNGGQALDAPVRARMESAFGVDFKGVRVHTDAQADALSSRVNAIAFTAGQDVFFRQGRYQPSTDEGRRLLAHELTHVVQQRGGPSRDRLAVGPANDRYEREVDQTVNRLLPGALTSARGTEAVPFHVGPRASDRLQMPLSPAPESIQRTIDTSIMLSSYSLAPLSKFTVSGSPYGDVVADMVSRALGSFGARNPIMKMKVVDSWYYYNPLFSDSVYSTRSWWRANLGTNSYWSRDDSYTMTFSYKNTATRPRQGTFATTSGSSVSETDTITGGAKLTIDKLELSASASRSVQTGTSESTTVTTTNFFEHDYDVSVAFESSTYNDSDFDVSRSFWGPETKQIAGPHAYSTSFAAGSITLYDDDSNPDNLTP